MSSWVNDLTGLISSLTSWVDPTCLREGYLHIQLKAKQKFSKYFCILQGEELLYYKSREDLQNGNQPAGTIDTTGLSSVDMVDSSSLEVHGSSDLLSHPEERPSRQSVSAMGRLSLASSGSHLQSLQSVVGPETELGAAHHHKLHSGSWAVSRAKLDLNRESSAAVLHPYSSDNSLTDSYKTDHLFRIQMAGKKPVMIAAKHNTERDNWVADIMHGILIKDFHTSPGSVKEGWLQTHSIGKGKMGMWRPSYIAYEPPNLRIMKTKVDKEPITLTLGDASKVERLVDPVFAFKIITGDPAFPDPVEFCCYSLKERDSWLATLAGSFDGPGGSAVNANKH
jgi:hypothetical protein